MKDIIETAIQVGIAVGLTGYGLYLLWQEYVPKRTPGAGQPALGAVDDEKTVVDITRRLRKDGKNKAADIAQSLLQAMLAEKSVKE
jgi:hypothetical protein